MNRDLREAIKHALEANAHKLPGWIAAVQKNSPARACELFAKLAEFIVPRLQRTELRVPITTPDGKPLVVTDAAEAASVYQSLMRGDLPLEAVDFSAITGPNAATQALRSGADPAAAQGQAPLGSSTTPGGRLDPARMEQGA